MNKIVCGVVAFFGVCCAELSAMDVSSLMAGVVVVSTTDKNSDDPNKNTDGSGFIIQDNYVVTSYHIIENAAKIKVTIVGGTEYSAKLIGKDEGTDIALLQIDSPRKLPAINWGDSDKVKICDRVYAIGNPLGLRWTVTSGIISGKERNLTNQILEINASGDLVPYLQTDAAINQGNSGGPLFDANGRVIGMVALFWTQNGNCIGINFAVPSNIVRKVVDQLKKYGKMQQGWIGIVADPIEKDVAEGLGIESGWIVKMVDEKSPAQRACLQVGDIILSMNGVNVSADTNFEYMSRNLPIGIVVPIKVLKQGKVTTLSISVEAKNDNEYFSVPEKKVQTAPPFKMIKELGIGVADLTQETRNYYNLPDDISGVLVVRADGNSKISEGDVICKVAQTAISSVDDFIKKLPYYCKNDRIVFYVFFAQDSDNRYITLDVKQEKKVDVKKKQTVEPQSKQKAKK